MAPTGPNRPGADWGQTHRANPFGMTTPPSPCPCCKLPTPGSPEGTGQCVLPNRWGTGSSPHHPAPQALQSQESGWKVPPAQSSAFLAPVSNTAGRRGARQGGVCQGLRLPSYRAAPGGVGSLCCPWEERLGGGGLENQGLCQAGLLPEPLRPESRVGTRGQPGSRALQMQLIPTCCRTLIAKPVCCQSAKSLPPLGASGAKRLSNKQQQKLCRCPESSSRADEDTGRGAVMQGGGVVAAGEGESSILLRMLLGPVCSEHSSLHTRCFAGSRHPHPHPKSPTWVGKTQGQGVCRHEERPPPQQRRGGNAGTRRDPGDAPFAPQP